MDPAAAASRVEALRTAIAALDAQRALLGGDVVDVALHPLRLELQALQRPREVERRLVTVLFADVAGSTALVERLDAEDALEVLGGMVERLAAVVRAHQGRVLQFAGDGFKAVFGGDGAREDDAERALRAGLAMLAEGRAHAEAVRGRHGILEMPLRIGVHTGPVAIGAGYEDDRTAVGATVHLAARMEQSAPLDSLHISHETWLHVRGRFDVEPLPPVRLKGLDAPVRSYLVLGLRPPGADDAERGIPGLRLSLVGRAAELDRLQAVVASAGRTGPPAVLTLVGDAGLGKSRLLRELAASLPAGRLLRLRAQPDGALRPAGLLRQLLTERFGIHDDAPAARARRRLTAGLRRLLRDAGMTVTEAHAAAHQLGHLAGLDFADSPHVAGQDPRLLREHAVAACGRALQALAAREGRAPVLLVEDLHWADPDSRVLLHRLAAEPGVPLALLITSRPGLPPDHPGEVLPLQPLAPADAEALVRTLLGGLETVPTGLIERITAQADGNPYYVEEFVRRLIDDGVIDTGQFPWILHSGRLLDLSLPSTLVGLLQARLDALPPTARHAAQQAAIVGHVFWDAALAEIDGAAPQALPVLAQRTVVHAHRTSAIDTATEWTFDHHLLHQVAYDTIPLARRREGHAAAARWLLTRARERGPEFLALTGDHAERAGDLALAVDCFDRAALQARQRYANAAALHYLRRAIDLLGDGDPDRSYRLLKRLDDLADAVGERDLQRQVMDEVDALLQRHPDDRRRAEAGYARALFEDRLSHHARARTIALETVVLAARCGHWRVAAELEGLLCWLAITAGDAPLARQRVDAGLAHVRRDPALVESETKLLVLSAMVSKEERALDAADATLQMALARADQIGEVRLRLGCLDNLAVVALERSHLDDARRWAGAMLEQARRAGATPRVAHALMHLAELARRTGDAAGAVAAWQESIAITRDNGDLRNWAAASYRCGRALTELEDRAGALAAFEAAQQVFGERMGDPANAAAVALHVAWCRWTLGRADDARATLEAALPAFDAHRVNDLAGGGLAARWAAFRLLDALGDARAGPWLADLHAQTQAAPVDPPDELQAAIEAASARYAKRAVQCAHRLAAGDAEAAKPDLPR
ncbi:MAG: AAA family ATPase [Burkholderiaceae bacterium]|nr:AAA family ATPase [Burkholderiaceae bacterium]